MSEQLLALVIALIGVSIILFGSRGPRRLLQAVVAPLGCLVRLVIGACVLLALLAGVVHWAMRKHQDQETGLEAQNAGGGENILLNQYPLLSQLDRAIYDPEAFADEVGNYGCLATVYVMIERGRGILSAKISDENYDLEQGALPRSYASGDQPFRSALVATEIRAGRPVILHGEGGPLKDHFMLVVGLRATADGGVAAVTHDPWKGRRIEVDMSDSPPVHPTIPSITISRLRLVRFGQ